MRASQTSAIDWSSRESHLLLNPRLPRLDQAQANRIYRELGEQLAGHIWLASSGSTRQPGDSIKLVAMSKAAILASAEAVNRHLRCQRIDSWLICLPSFHIGGLAIFARAWFASCAWRDLTHQPWNPIKFVEAVRQAQTTLSALVPTQVHDLVSRKLAAPPTLRAIVVGGGALSERLYFEARNLGWPLLPSFGMTETCSQIATAELASLGATGLAPLRTLDHLELVLDLDGRLGVKGTSLLSGVGLVREEKIIFIEQKTRDIFWTEDHVRLADGYLYPLGRGADFVKVGGESLNLNEVNLWLTDILAELPAKGDCAVVLAVQDERLGKRLALFWQPPLTSDQINLILSQLNSRLLAIAQLKPQDCYGVPALPRTPLGKIARHQLTALAAGR